MNGIINFPKFLDQQNRIYSLAEKSFYCNSITCDNRKWYCSLRVKIDKDFYKPSIFTDYVYSVRIT